MIGYGPALASIRPHFPDTVLVSLATRGIPQRLRLVNVASGTVVKGDSIRGDLRDAWGDDSDLWLLTAYALHRVSRTDLAVKATIKVPRFRWWLIPMFAGQFLALSQPERVRTPMVSIRGLSVKTITMPTPDLAIDDDEGCLVFSFWAAEARAFDSNLRPARVQRRLPLGLSPVRLGDEVIFLPATRDVARNVHPREPSVTWLYPTGRLAAFDLSTWALTREGAAEGLDRLVGVDSGGRIVAADSAKTLSLIDPIKLSVVARWNLAERAVSLAQAGATSIAYRTRDGRLRVVDWFSL
jgi:hypothetical protein